MSILPQRQDLRRPRLHRVDQGHQPGADPGLVEAYTPPRPVAELAAGIGSPVSPPPTAPTPSDAQADDARRLEGDRATFRRLIASAAAGYELAAAEARSLEQLEGELDFHTSIEGRNEAKGQAVASLRLVEQALAGRLEGSLPYLAPGLEARNAAGWVDPFGVVVDGVAYLFIGEDGDDRPAVIARVPLDRIVGLG